MNTIKALFWFTEELTFVFNIFSTARKKSPRTKWAKFKYESDNNKKFLTVVVCSVPTSAYIERLEIFTRSTVF